MFYGDQSNQTYLLRILSLKLIVPEILTVSVVDYIGFYAAVCMRFGL